MTDFYIEAVRLYSEGDHKRKLFAEACAYVSGERTQDLAADCECSVDTIEQHRNAYRLYRIRDKNIESEQVRKLWEELKIDKWKTAAKLYARYDMSPFRVYDYLTESKGMSRESFSAHVDEKENCTPKWIRRLVSFARGLRNMGEDWKTEIKPDLRDEFDAWTKQGAELLERIARQ